MQLADKISTMTSLIKDFGHFADLYYTKFKWTFVRFYRSQEFKGKLKQFNNNFYKTQQDLQFLLTAQTAGDQQKLLLQTEETKKNTETILDHLGQISPLKQSAVKKILNGRALNSVIDDLDTVKELSKAINDSEPLPPNVISALRGDLESLLSKNLDQFTLKLESVQKVLEAAIGQSTDIIMHKLESGPHKLIDDEEVAEIWKGQ
ncbi:hypothetical protein HMN09_00340200 [Mycena chlorophos]|uniref:Uncharacterized protein n=1 Tax=Mycena chlorophos TaxID=658473 RepID=A0A8H6WGZ7_MYCCL|nr:hypothetical protein HMN09_00340200 [Mycena chlorophos]